MTRRTKTILTALALSVATANAGAAYAFQADASAALRASGQAGERYDGYLGAVGDAPASVRAEIDAVNIKRRAFYTDLAAKRGAKIEEVGATTACTIFATKVQPGQYYQLQDGVWRQRDDAPIPRPTYCG
ncbi:YdbL family protein [Allosphingosinicella flava]|uniref:YdbL family protein n=1 Tax=Allosphingosinicella flava TaxID=2771430 RepID=A0A7T2GK02_9SPHN|nr:YdbL family protein [Sphingosinicella flava]QPQ55287.1 YdbL family protein [Sphingosinicella flava]